jgi:hypothetical protein
LHRNSIVVLSPVNSLSPQRFYRRALFAFKQANKRTSEVRFRQSSTSKNT